MGTRNLNEVDRQIVETREHIDIQQNVVRKFSEGGQIADATLAEGIFASARKKSAHP